jgi:glycosyltransferase involved in cell wall biosynthesis
MLDSVTPVLLTYNEGPNIGRTLAKLAWAKDIVVVDSGSTDETLRLLGMNPRVRVFRRAFDNHPAQWRYGMQETAIRTPWVLRLDADYQLPDGMIAEIAALDPNGPEAAYRAAFDYAVFARKLISSLYPAKPVLLRQGCYSISDEGHSEGWVVEGPVGILKSRIVHDDWKSMRDWTIAQARYMTREREKLGRKRHGLRDWLRIHPPLMPIAVFFYCLFVKGLLFSGKAGLLYSLQRTVAEGILALLILEKRLAPQKAGMEEGRDSTILAPASQSDSNTGTSFAPRIARD